MPNIILRFLLCLLIALSAWNKAAAAVYFVATDGNDMAKGTYEQPWADIEKSIGRLIPGDTLYIRHGIYRQRFDIRVSGNPESWITIKNYKNEIVNIWFSVDLSEQKNWMRLKKNRWCTRNNVFTTDMNYDLATIWYDDQSHWRHKKSNPDQLCKQWDFYQNKEKGRIEVYSSTNPASLARHIEAPRSRNKAPYQFVTNIYGNYLLIEGINYRYINVHGIKISDGTHHVVFRNGSITHGGGGNISPSHSPPVRWGDCVDITNNAHHIWFEHSVFGEFPDGTLTNQGTRGQQSYLYLRNNYIYNSTNGIHCWFGETGSSNEDVSLFNIYYEANTFEDIGKGWFEDQGVMIGGIQFIPRENVKTENIFIRDNLFLNCGATNYKGDTWRGVNCPINLGGGYLMVSNNIIFDSPVYGIFARRVHQDFKGIIRENLLVKCKQAGIKIHNKEFTDPASIHDNIEISSPENLKAHPTILEKEANNFYIKNQENLSLEIVSVVRENKTLYKFLMNGYNHTVSPQLTIRNSKEEIIKSCKVVTPPGSVNIWDCTNIYGEALPEGKYTIELIAGNRRVTRIIRITTSVSNG